MNGYLTDGSSDAPKFKAYLNLDNLFDLPSDSLIAGLEGEALMQRLADDGFEGVQVTHQNPLGFESALPHVGLDRINLPEEAETVFARHVARGDAAVTLHLGWGMEDDAAIDRLVDAVLSASEKHNLPAFIETHRATITQDMWRTVELTKRFPELLFNGDFSHYYCGQEMVYGDFSAKLAFMQPIFDRVGFMHGRIASPGNMQVPIENIVDRPKHSVGEFDYLAHFREIWTRAMAGFRRLAGPGSVLVFAPELLTSKYFYARLVPDEDGQLREESDRYLQALLHKDLALECFEAARN